MGRSPCRRSAAATSSFWTYRCPALAVSMRPSSWQVTAQRRNPILTMHGSDNLVGQAFRAGAARISAEERKRRQAGWRRSRHCGAHKPYLSARVSGDAIAGYLSIDPAVDPKHLNTPRAPDRESSCRRKHEQAARDHSRRQHHKDGRNASLGGDAKAGCESSADLTLYAARNDLVNSSCSRCFDFRPVKPSRGADRNAGPKTCSKLQYRQPESPAESNKSCPHPRMAKPDSTLRASRPQCQLHHLRHEERSYRHLIIANHRVGR